MPVPTTATLSFIGNRALIEGGAIYYRSLDLQREGMLRPNDVVQCIITLPIVGLSVQNTIISFTNNTPRVASIIFGATIKHCPWAQKISVPDDISLYEILLRDHNSTFVFDEVPRGPRFVSSLPEVMKVTPLSTMPVQLFPGQSTNITIKVLDANNPSGCDCRNIRHKPHRNCHSQPFAGRFWILVHRSQCKQVLCVHLHLIKHTNFQFHGLSSAVSSWISVWQLHWTVLLRQTALWCTRSGMPWWVGFFPYLRPEFGGLSGTRKHHPGPRGPPLHRYIL